MHCLIIMANPHYFNANRSFSSGLCMMSTPLRVVGETGANNHPARHTKRPRVSQAVRTSPPPYNPNSINSSPHLHIPSLASPPPSPVHGQPNNSSSDISTRAAISFTHLPPLPLIGFDHLQVSSVEPWSPNALVANRSTLPLRFPLSTWPTPSSLTSSPSSAGYGSRFTSSDVSFGRFSSNFTSGGNLLATGGDSWPTTFIGSPEMAAHEQKSLLLGPEARPNTSLSGPSNPLRSTDGRDSLLAYAHHLYNASFNGDNITNPPIRNSWSPLPVFNTASDTTVVQHVYVTQLMPLLTLLRDLHPEHPPTMLLLGSVEFSLGNLETSLAINQEILERDPNYVEAMFNIGHIMKAMGREGNAEVWWRKALAVQPMYWDALDHLLSMVLAPCATLPNDLQPNAVYVDVYRKALDICRFIQSQLVDTSGNLQRIVPSVQVHRLVNVYRTSANLLSLLGAANSQSIAGEYISAIELAIRAPFPCPETERYTFRDLVVAAFVSCMVLTGSAGTSYASSEADSYLEKSKTFLQDAGQPGFDILAAIHAADGPFIETILRRESRGLPTIYLFPDQASRLPMMLFPSSLGVLPSLCTRVAGGAPMTLPLDWVRQSGHSMLSHVFLSLAKRCQEGSPDTHAFTDGKGRHPLRTNTSLITIVYYLALSLFPSASTYNNIGVVFSAIPTVITRDADGAERSISGADLARTYYEKGLQLDPTHPHLLTNLGSLLKDRGQIPEAILVYQRALSYQPDLDVTLANIANAIKDIGRPWDAIPYYSRAVSVNSDLPEAVCGLANSLMAVCDFRGMGPINRDIAIDNNGTRVPNNGGVDGWMSQLAKTCDRQLRLAYSENVGIIRAANALDGWIHAIESALGQPLSSKARHRWRTTLEAFYTDFDRVQSRVNEGGFIVRLVEWLQRRMQRRWYVDAFGKGCETERPLDLPSHGPYTMTSYPRPAMPHSISLSVPSVLPFHTFTCPLPPSTIRLISHRNALRISHATLTKSWIPKHVYPPPTPIHRRLNVGYVSSDLSNHPLAHLMQSVFRLHDRHSVKVHVYATSHSDGSAFRAQIEANSECFVDVATWPVSAIVERIVNDGIHILVNLGGYTKGAKNEIFAARPSPVQISLLGFAGTLAAGWCDYLICDEIACPQDLFAIERDHKGEKHGPPYHGLYVGAEADPESHEQDWMFTERFIYMPHTFMVADHKQSSRKDENLSVDERAQVEPAKLWADEQRRRAEMRRKLFPDIPDNYVIFANFNQLYKIDPEIFATWLRILERVPHSILWLLRFPAAGEAHLLRTAEAWAGTDIALRIRFMNVAPKEEHIYRGRVADLFLDTVECNAHTIAADVLWTGTPIVTWPKYRYKMCSRVGASIAYATGFGSEMVVSSLEEYEARAVFFAQTLDRGTDDHGKGKATTEETHPNSRDALINLRRSIYLNRDRMPLFDTARWTANVEKAYFEAWRRWVEDDEDDDDDDEEEWKSRCIRVHDDDPIQVYPFK